MKRHILGAISLALIFVSLSIETADAAKRRSLGRYTCGLVQRQHFGIADTRYNLALNWLDFSSASPGPGVVVVQYRKGRALGGGPGGHVSRIVSMLSPCRAIVADEKGQYERDICRALAGYVSPSSFGISHSGAASRSSGRHARSRGGFDPPAFDRMSAAY